LHVPTNRATDEGLLAMCVLGSNLHFNQKGLPPNDGINRDPKSVPLEGVIRLPELAEKRRKAGTSLGGGYAGRSQ
jgi:hypothetical protein